uniref:Apple domain-containing protein n=1 Tax=Rodentolepis nana TaxID=102285 RepID=A0A0R3TSG8_RODNA
LLYRSIISSTKRQTSFTVILLNGFLGTPFFNRTGQGLTVFGGLIDIGSSSRSRSLKDCKLRCTKKVISDCNTAGYL